MISRPPCVGREKEAETRACHPPGDCWTAIKDMTQHHVLSGTEEATWIVQQVWAQLSFEEWLGARGAVRWEGASSFRGLKGWQVWAQLACCQPKQQSWQGSSFGGAPLLEKVARLRKQGCSDFVSGSIDLFVQEAQERRWNVLTWEDVFGLPHIS